MGGILAWLMGKLGGGGSPSGGGGGGGEAAPVGGGAANPMVAPAPTNTTAPAASNPMMPSSFGFWQKPSEQRTQEDVLKYLQSVQPPPTPTQGGLQSLPQGQARLEKRRMF